MSVLRLFPLVLLVLLLGCPTEGDDRLPSCSPPDEQELNTLSATIDGEAWTGTTTGYQIIAGPALQVSATGQDADGQTVNVVLRLLESTVWSVDEETDEVVTDDGDPIEDILDDEALADFDMGDANTNGANATVTVSPNPSMSTGEGDGGGFASITASGVPADGEQGAAAELVGCFAFDVESQDGSETASLTDGGFRLTSL